MTKPAPKLKLKPGPKVGSKLTPRNSSALELFKIYENSVQINLAPGRAVMVSYIPHDLTEAEARKITAVILAYGATPDTTPVDDTPCPAYKLTFYLSGTSRASDVQIHRPQVPHTIRGDTIYYLSVNPVQPGQVPFRLTDKEEHDLMRRLLSAHDIRTH